MAAEPTTEWNWSKAARQKVHALGPHWLIGSAGLVGNGLGQAFPGETEDEAIAYYRSTPAWALRKRLAMLGKTDASEIEAKALEGIYVMTVDVMDAESEDKVMDECGTEDEKVRHSAMSKWVLGGPFETEKMAKEWRDERDENLLICKFREAYHPT